MPLDDERWKAWFEAAWTEREEGIYRRDFIDVGAGIYPLDADVFHRLGEKEVDPRWLTIGVFESPPNDERSSWLYVTSGLSNAWEADEPQADGASGLGVEFLVQTTGQAPWALNIARNLAAYQLLLACGRFEDRGPLDFWARTSVGGAIDGESSELRSLMFVPAPHFPGTRQLVSGRFEYLQAIGVTAQEHAFGVQHGLHALHERLLSHEASPVIDPRRESVIR